MNNILFMEYNFLHGKPRSKMEIHLDIIFEETDIKALHKVHTRKVIKHILKKGSQENIDQVHEWLKNNSPFWLKEFEIIRG
jgi:carbamoylphosphate synthase small subunit